MTYRSWRDNRTIRLGAGIAYYGLSTVVPLLTLSVALAGAFFSTDEMAAVLSTIIQDALGNEAADVTSVVIQRVMSTVSAGLGLVGLISLLLAASVLFVALQDALNVIWRAPYQPGFRHGLRRRVLAFAVVLLAGCLLIATFALATVVGAVEALMPFDVASSTGSQGSLSTSSRGCFWAPRSASSSACCRRRRSAGATHWLGRWSPRLCSSS